MRWRWLTDKPRDPWDTMATDETLFQEIVRGEATLPILRIYAWDRECVSIGRLQDENSVRMVYPELPLVRRPTGGRAVVHGRDLSFSIMTRSEWLPVANTRGVLASYRQIMAGFIQALQEIGTRAQLGGIETASSDRVHCFSHIAAGDVADAQTGQKLIGSAQRREHGVILQQMSIPAEVIPDQACFLVVLSQQLMQTLAIEDWQRIQTPEN